MGFKLDKSPFSSLKASNVGSPTLSYHRAPANAVIVAPADWKSSERVKQTLAGSRMMVLSKAGSAWLSPGLICRRRHKAPLEHYDGGCARS